MDVSIIIVTYNVREILARCLATIPAATEGLSVEVFVVDNGTGDGTWDSIVSRADVQAIRGSRDLGFGRGNNLAASRAAGRWYLFLNPDTELPPLGVRRLVERADADPALGILGPRLELADGSLDPAACRTFPTPALAALRLLRWPRRFLPRGVQPYNIEPSARRQSDDRRCLWRVHARACRGVSSGGWVRPAILHLRRRPRPGASDFPGWLADALCAVGGGAPPQAAVDPASVPCVRGLSFIGRNGSTIGSTGNMTGRGCGRSSSPPSSCWRWAPLLAKRPCACWRLAVTRGQ